MGNHLINTMKLLNLALLAGAASLTKPIAHTAETKLLVTSRLPLKHQDLLRWLPSLSTHTVMPMRALTLKENGLSHANTDQLSANTILLKLALGINLRTVTH